MSKMSMPQLIAGPALIYTEYISIQLPLKTFFGTYGYSWSGCA